ncbi:MAG TPA: hypothetical protein V6D48_06695 [Oculatellaceae cyanobacterium]
MVGTASGLFAGLYWSVLELLTHELRQVQGLNLLMVMPLAGLVLGLVIHFLGNPGEIAVIVDNILIPGLNPALAMICKMAALNAGVTRTPVSTTLLLTKLTNVSPFTPILFASLIGFFLAPKVPLIASQLKVQKGELSEASASHISD